MGLQSRLKRRVEQMEQRLRPGELCAVIQGFVDESGARVALPSDDPSLQQGLNDEGQAVISRWWWVHFFEGTKGQQQTRLKELRRNPQFQTPSGDNEIPVRFEGGVTCEDMYARYEE